MAEIVNGAASVALHISDGLRKEMDRQGILEDYLRNVVSHAEDTSEKLVDMDSGRFIAHRRIGHITCWVVYGPENDGFRIDSAYMHRMEING